MNTDENFVELFRQFVLEKLKSHAHELKISFRNRQYRTAEFMENEFKEHRRNFDQEIQKKIDSLIVSSKPWLHVELQRIKKEYLSKFDLMEQALQ